jgi:Zn-dependent hydrolases, including glyoxylases
MKPHALRIDDDVWQVGGPQLSAPEDAAVYLVSGGAEAALIDAGCGGSIDVILANVAAAGVEPAKITQLLLTHCHYDHSGGAHHVRHRLGCKVVMHVADAPFLEAGDHVVTAASWYRSRITPCPVDRRLVDQTETIIVGNRTVTAVHIPGHSPGSVAFFVDTPAGRIVFAQDVHGPLHPSLLSDPVAYQASLRRLLDLRAQTLCEGHYGIFCGSDDVAAFICDFLH